MVPATQSLTAVLYVFLSAALSIRTFVDDTTWLAMLERDNISWCSSVILSAHWILSDEQCAISEALGLEAVAGVRDMADRTDGQVRVADAVLRTPFGGLRGVHLLMPFDFNENVSFIRLADGALPQHGMPCRAAGTAPPAGRGWRLVSETVLAMPHHLCSAFGLAAAEQCARSYPHHFPCGARPPVWVSCRRLLTGWCDVFRPCSDAYQTHLGHDIHPVIPWLKARIPELPEPGRLSRSPPSVRATPLLCLLLSVQSAFSCLLTLTSLPNTLQCCHR